MDALRQAIYTTLSSDTTIQSLVGSYRGDYAIFDWFIPDDARLPLIHYEVVYDGPFDSKTNTGREVLVDISVITSTAGDPAAINEKIRTLLHRQALTVTGYTNIITNVEGQTTVALEGDEKFMAMTVKFVMVKTIGV